MDFRASVIRRLLKFRVAVFGDFYEARLRAACPCILSDGFAHGAHQCQVLLHVLP